METLDTTKTLTGVSYEDTNGTVHQFTLSSGDDSNNVKSVLTGTLGTTTIKNTNTNKDIEAGISVTNGTSETATGAVGISVTVSDNRNKAYIQAMSTSGGFLSISYADDGSVNTVANVDNANKGIEQTISFTDTVTNTTYSTELNQYATGVKYSKSTDDSTMPESDKEVARKGDLSNKQDKLTAGTGIKIENNIISANLSVQPLYKHELSLNISIGNQSVVGIYHYLSNNNIQITNVTSIDDNFNLNIGPVYNSDELICFDTIINKSDSNITIIGLDKTFTKLTGTLISITDTVTQLI